MIAKEIFYAVECNRCGEICNDGEHSFWSDEDNAIEQALESEWVELKNKHYCPDCHEIDEETEEIKVLPEYPECLKKLIKFIKSTDNFKEKITESQDVFDVNVVMWNSPTFQEFEENYIKEILSSKVISIMYPPKEKPYSRKICLIKILK